MSRGERPIGVADPHRDGRDVVRVGGREEPRGAGGERVGGRGAGGQRLIDDVDPVERVASDVRIVGHDEGHRLSDEAHHVARDRRLQVALAALGGGDAVRDDRRRRHVGRGQHGADAGEISRVLRVDRNQPRMSVRRAQHRGVQLAGHAHVVHESGGALHEPLAAQPGMRLADHGADPSTLSGSDPEEVARPTGQEVVDEHEVDEQGQQDGHEASPDHDQAPVEKAQAFLLRDGAEVSLWEVEHTATPDGRHMCEVYVSEDAARDAMERRAAQVS